MGDLYDTGIKCHVCDGSGYMLDVAGDYEPFEYPCRDCEGTGLSVYGRAMQELFTPSSLFDKQDDSSAKAIRDYLDIEDKPDNAQS